MESTESAEAACLETEQAKLGLDKNCLILFRYQNRER